MFKLKDYFKLSINGGVLISNVYKPYINYTWSNTFQVANKMYSKNIGSNGQDLQLFSGQGFKSNGTNQTITIPVNATVLTEIKRVNGSVVLNTNQQIITNYVIGTGAAAVHTDYFLFTDVLTADEIALYSANPNQFFQNVQDGVIDNCVLNMPLHGVDKYQVDYSRYSVSTTELLVNGNFDTNLTGWTGVNANVTWVNGQIEVSGTASAPANQKAESAVITAVIGKLYRLEYEITKLGLDNTGFIANGFTFPTGLTYYYPHVLGKGSVVIKATGSSMRLSLHAGTSVGTIAQFDNVSVREISGINDVINYTADCVTLAKQLSYGSQEANFFHTSSGVPIRTGLSPFFESTPYWNNYGNTGWIPETNQEFVLETIIQNAKEGSAVIYEGLGIETNNAADFWIRQLKATGGINLTIGTASIDTPYINKDFYCVCVKVKTTGVSFYINGVLIGTLTYSYNRSLNTGNRPFTIGGVYRYGVDKLSTKVVRHFKVITDSKTINNYDALVEYNKVVQKGLLANFLLDENGNYIKDESNNYIMT